MCARSLATTLACVVVFFLLAGCEAPAPDRWSQTASPCEAAVEAEGDLELAWLPEPCREALSADFAVINDSFSASNLSCVQGGLLELFSRPAGRVGALEASEHVRAPFIRLMRRQARLQGTDDLRQVAYNLAAAQISATRAADFEEADWRAAFDPETSEVLVREPLGGACDVDAGLVLFHEAMHGLAPPHVDCPEQPDDACDRSWRGAYGLQAALADRQAAFCDAEREPARCALIEGSRAHAAASVIRD